MENKICSNCVHNTYNNGDFSVGIQTAIITVVM